MPVIELEQVESGWEVVVTEIVGEREFVARIFFTKEEAAKLKYEQLQNEVCNGVH